MSGKFIILFSLYFVSLTFAKRGGWGSATNAHRYPSNTHSYPHQTAHASNYPQSSQTHNYPRAPGLSGNTASQGYRYNSRRTEVHNHYHYSPPQHISYGSTQHPVFQGQPPVYVYEYRNSGSRFDTLLTGLALYNLGRMTSNHDHYNRDSNYYREYRGTPGEICKLVISKTNGDYEETRIDCKLMSTIIWDAQSNQAPTSNTVTKTITVMQNVTKDGSTTVMQNTTVVDALQVKGPSLIVKPGMTCFMIRISRDSSQLKRNVDCSLLQEYASKSLRYYNKCALLLPLVLQIVSTILIAFLLK